MVCRASIGEIAPPFGCRLDAASGFSGECVRSGKILRCDDAETDPRVDAQSCRALGIRSILAAPIFAGGDVVGLLEVFSPHPFAFDDRSHAVVEQLAQDAMPAEPRAIPAPKLTIEFEPAHRVFFRNLADIVSPPRVAPLKLTSLPARFWADVFVPSRLPWERFRQSLALHLITIVVLLGAMESGLFQGSSVRLQTVNRSDVVYFSPEEYLQALAASGRAVGGSPDPVSVRPASLRVAGEKPGAAAAPAVRVRSELRALQLVAGGSVMPAPPLTAAAQLRLGPAMAPVTVVAPAPEVRSSYGGRGAGGLGPVAVVGPPPSALTLPAARGSITAPAGVVGPPPSMAGQWAGRGGVINVGHIEVVGPAPQMPGDGSAMMARVEQAALHGPMSLVVPPAPALGGVGAGGVRSAEAVGAMKQAALPPAIVRGATYPSAPPAPRDAGAGDTRSPQESVDRAPLQNSQQLSVSFIGLALSLRSSSYFASQEVFLAEDRLSRFQSKLIKLVYEFLPYQPRLSDYGPNYPAVDKLRVTRDPQCDEPLGHVMSSFNLSARPVPDRLQQDLKGQPQQSTLECYRTTADDYRRARVRH